MDAGRAWVEAYAAERPALEEALADGAVRLAAERTTLRWHRACEQRVHDLRRGKAVRSQLMTSHLHRACTEVARALITQARLLLAAKVLTSAAAPHALTRLHARGAAFNLFNLPRRAAGRAAALAECVTPGTRGARCADRSMPLACPRSVGHPRDCDHRAGVHTSWLRCVLQPRSDATALPRSCW